MKLKGLILALVLVFAAVPVVMHCTTTQVEAAHTHSKKITGKKKVNNSYHKVTWRCGTRGCRVTGSFNEKHNRVRTFYQYAGTYSGSPRHNIIGSCSGCGSTYTQTSNQACAPYCRLIKQYKSGGKTIRTYKCGRCGHTYSTKK